MNRLAKLFSLISKVSVFLLLVPGLVMAGPDKEEDKTLSPYFLVKSEDSSVDQLPLKDTSVEANIAGVIADVKVAQLYRNEGKSTLEAIYVFPASTRAAVYGMKMTIGERTIEAQIKKREEARQDYERARSEGKSASLLEQQRPNVFQMNVANILPGDEIKVELRYTELLVPEEGTYEFVYPTVVGPRYSDMKAKDASDRDSWVSNPYLKEGEAPTSTLSLRTELDAGVPIQKVACDTHKVNISYDTKTRASVLLDASEKSGGNRDFILRYQLLGKAIEGGLLLSRGKEENFFLAMLQPPKRITDEIIPPRDYVFIVDVSGSMRGFPLDISKKLLDDLISNLRPTDTFNVMLFSGGQKVLAEKSIPATQANIERAKALLGSQYGGGSTQLLPALKRALALPKSDDLSRSIVIATDGYVHVETEAFDLIRKNLDEANVFSFGIGSSVNRFLIEGMARAGGGEPFVITKPEHAKAEAEKLRKFIQTPVLTDISVSFPGFDAYDVEPLSVGDLFAERPVLVYGKWRGEAKGKIVLEGKSGKGRYTKRLEVAEVKSRKENAALAYLWARNRLAILSDYNKLRPNDERVGEITNIALKYHLLSAYTSFVAVDSKVRREGEKLVSVKQPLPLPEGVSGSALGGGVNSMRMTKALSGRRLVKRSGRHYAKGESAFSGRVRQAEVADALEMDSPAEEYKSKEQEKSHIRGSLSIAEINNVFLSHQAELKRCLKQRGLLSKYGEKGIRLALLIDSQGKVKAVRILDDKLRGTKAGVYLVQKISTLVFPKSKDGKPVSVEYVLRFDKRGRLVPAL